MTSPILTSITDEQLEAVRSSAEQSDTGYACLHHTSYQAIISRLRAAEKASESRSMRIKELDLLFGRYLLGMKASVIELDHGKGAVAAMQWIINGLEGPGELPPEEEMDAQAFFDREIVAVNDGMAEVMAFYKSQREQQP